MHQRMRALLLALALCAAWLGSPGVARAQDDEEEEEDYYSRPGAYLLAQFSNNVLFDGGYYSTGAAGAFGYRINRFLAAELAGDWIAGFKTGISNKLVGGTYGINVKGYALGGRFQPYALAGMGATFLWQRNADFGPFHDAEWDMSFRLGLGLDYYPTEQLGLNIGPTFVIPVGINSGMGIDAAYVSVGVGAFLRFGEY